MEKSKNDTDHRAYIRARNQAKKKCKKSKTKQEEAIAKEAKNNPKAFWNYIKTKTTSRSGISDIKKQDGTKTKTDQEKTEVLNSFFHSVFTEEDVGPLPTPPVYNYMEKLTDIDISEEEVRKIPAGLHVDKAAGPDQISPVILTQAADLLSYPVTKLFERSIEEGNVPQDWRCATVTPIFKKGSRAEACNYRPVSLTCILCKCMEKIIRRHAVKHVEDSNLISKDQHGFVSGRSCTTQLLEVMDEWTEILDDGGSIDAIYMDFQKAFDACSRKLRPMESKGKYSNGSKRS